MTFTKYTFLIRKITPLTLRPRQSLSTIYALSTSPGKAGIAVIRLSGPESRFALQSLTSCSAWSPRVMRYVNIRCPESQELLDQGLAVWFEANVIGSCVSAPRSYTGEAMCELHVHGSVSVVSDVLHVLGNLPGLTPAAPGEFSKRALLNNKLDLLEVTGLGDLIDAETRAQRRAALRQATGEVSLTLNRWRQELKQIAAMLEAYLDFGEDDDIGEETLQSARQQITTLAASIDKMLNDSRKGSRLREGFNVVVAGDPNVGKSSLVNLISAKPISIVTPIPGTTRDILDVPLSIGALPVVLTDTAGIRDSKDPIEVEGVSRARERLKTADVIVLVIDGSVASNLACQVKTKMDEMYDYIKDTDPQPKIIPVVNKVDLMTNEVMSQLKDDVLTLSCMKLTGIEALLERLQQELAANMPQPNSPILTRTFQLKFLKDCRDHLRASLGIVNDQGHDDDDDTSSNQNANNDNISSNQDANNDDTSSNQNANHDDTSSNQNASNDDISSNQNHDDDDLSSNRNAVQPDIMCEDVRLALAAIGRITGHVPVEEILDTLFATFCIGK